MSFISKMTTWRCDSCLKEETITKNGLPHNWCVAVVAIDYIEDTCHMCSDCKEAIKDQSVAAGFFSKWFQRRKKNVSN